LRGRELAGELAENAGEVLLLRSEEWCGDLVKRAREVRELNARLASMGLVEVSGGAAALLPVVVEASARDPRSKLEAYDDRTLLAGLSLGWVRGGLTASELMWLEAFVDPNVRESTDRSELRRRRDRWRKALVRARGVLRGRVKGYLPRSYVALPAAARPDSTAWVARVVLGWSARRRRVSVDGRRLRGPSDVHWNSR
jgi:hypothetical protein